MESVDIEVRVGGRRAGIGDESPAPPWLGAAATGSAIEKGGMLKLLAFQFRPDCSAPAVRRSRRRQRWRRASALLVASRLIAFRGTGGRGAGGACRGSGAEGQSIEAPGQRAGCWRSNQGSLLLPARRARRSSGPAQHPTPVIAGRFPNSSPRHRQGRRGRPDPPRRRREAVDYFINGADVLAAADGTCAPRSMPWPRATPALRQPGEALEDYMTRVIAGQGERLVAGTPRCSETMSSSSMRRESSRLRPPAGRAAFA